MVCHGYRCFSPFLSRSSPRILGPNTYLAIADWLSSASAFCQGTPRSAEIFLTLCSKIVQVSLLDFQNMDPQPWWPNSPEKVELRGARQRRVIIFQSSAGGYREETANTHHESDFDCARVFVFAMAFEIALLIAILVC
jgi:hypothetical protein